MIFSDDFNDNYLDPAKWEVVIETGGEVREQNQRLEFIMPRGSYSAFVVSRDMHNVEGKEATIRMSGAGCSEVSFYVANEKVSAMNPDNCYRVALINVYDPERPSVGEIDLRVHHRVDRRWKLLYGETIGSYPADRDMVVEVMVNFGNGKASFYADWGLGEEFLAEESYALPSYENYMYMRSESDRERFGTAWFDDFSLTTPPIRGPFGFWWYPILNRLLRRWNANPTYRHLLPRRGYTINGF